MPIVVEDRMQSTMHLRDRVIAIEGELSLLVVDIKSGEPDAAMLRLGTLRDLLAALAQTMQELPVEPVNDEWLAMKIQAQRFLAGLPEALDEIAEAARTLSPGN